MYPDPYRVWRMFRSIIRFIARRQKKRELAEQLVTEADVAKKCRNCGGLNPVDYPNCRDCGTVFANHVAPEWVKICPKCSAQNPNLRSTCLSCGVWFGYTKSRQLDAVLLDDEDGRR